MSEKICRWGILGTAGIACKNWQAIRRSGNGTLVGVASRSLERAEQWIATNQSHVSFDPAPQAHGSYEELLARPDIDAVYIPLPTGLRKDWVIAAAAAGKHVLAEKPCGTNADEVEEIVAACKQHKVQFMDGVMFMHSDRLPKMRGALDDGESVGEIKRMSSNFSFLAPEEFLTSNIRMSSDLEPLGALGDLGWYNIRLFLWAMNYAMPTEVQGRVLTQQGRADSPNPVPLEFEANLRWDGGVSASFYCSFVTETQQWANISGTKGYLHIRDFVLPFSGYGSRFEINQPRLEVNGCDFDMIDRSREFVAEEFSQSHPNAQEVKLFRNFAALALSGRPDPHWPDIALKTQQILDQCLG